jgi:hypothetical protein
MKVKELIAKLQEFDEELEVWVETTKENAKFLTNLGSEYESQWTRIQKLQEKEMTESRNIFVIT